MRLLLGGFAAALAAIGVTAMLAPKFSAGQYGVRVSKPAALAFVRASGARDAVLAGVLLCVLDEPRLARRTLATIATLGLVDGAIVAAHHGGLRPQHAAHLGGFLAMAITALAIHPNDRP